MDILLSDKDKIQPTFQEYLGNMLQGQYATAQEALDAAKEAMDFAIEE